MRLSNYDKKPSVKVNGEIVIGWASIIEVLTQKLGENHLWIIETYIGIYEDDFIKAFSKTGRRVVLTRNLMRNEQDIKAMTARFMTDDVLFGFLSNIRIDEYFDDKALSAFKRMFAYDDNVVLIGCGASLFAFDNSPIVYADMARWEIQQRFRKHEIKALGIDNHEDSTSLQYKRGYFNDWRVCDRIKQDLMDNNRVSYWIDSNDRNAPKMISNETFCKGMADTATRAFRVVPFFDPAPWGGQWMKTVCNLNPKEVNYGWCFDCVPEENSLYLNVNGTLFEIPAKDVVMTHARELLGPPVEARFGKDFPIRFDFLDTMEGGNLSLQVHPTNEFAHKNFGLQYTQDESYYLMDAAEDAVVYLGLKKDVDKKQMFDDLRASQRGEIVFDAEKYVNKIHACKHDHYLIPAGTIHCSGRNAMVLEISSTPNLFTFKLWDWQRLGLDGKPRPINVERGEHVVDFERDTDFVESKLHNRFEIVKNEYGNTEEKTGLHENEFIETRRNTFSVPVVHDTHNSVNVINLVEGEEAFVDSPNGSFEPLVVHYAETFIIPACVNQFRIAPYGKSKGCTIKTMKAYVRI